MMSSYDGLSQGWVIEGWVDVNHNDCAVEVITSGSITIGGINIPEIYSEGSRKYVSLTRPDNVNPSGTLTANGTGHCAEGYPCNTPETPELCPPMPAGTFGASYSGPALINLDSENCIEFNFSSDTGASAQVFGNIIFYPRLKVVGFVESPDCSGTTVTARSNCYGSLVWEYSDLPEGTYHPISNMTSQTIFITAADVYQPGYSRYGSRWVRVSDPNRPGRTSLPFLINIRVPAPTVEVSATSPSCHDGLSNILVTINHPDPVFQNQFIVTLDNTVNGTHVEQVSISGFSHTFTGQFYGNYKVHVDNVTDIIPICGVDSNQITNIVNPPSITITFPLPSHNGYYISCFGGSDGVLTANASGGTGSFMNYSWTKDNLVYPSGNGQQNVSGLSVGSYAVSFTDTNGCPANNNSSPVMISAPPSISIGFSTSNQNGTGFAVSCHDGPNNSNGTITAIPSGGVGGFNSYSWDGRPETSQTISGLPEGLYTVHLKDANACNASDSKQILAPQPISVNVIPILQFRGYAVSCADEDDGEIKATATGGVGGFTYSWSQASVNIDVGSEVTGKSANVPYTVTVSDLNSCSGSGNITLIPPPPIDFIVDLVQPVSCHGNHDAELEVTGVSNAYGAPDFLWSTGEHSSFISGKSSGTLAITVSDQLNCSATKPFQILDPPVYTTSINPISNFNGSFIQCNGGSNGRIEASLLNELSALVSGEYFKWYKNGADFAEGSNLNSIDQLAEGQYKVEVKYNLQCIAEHTFNLYDPDPIVVTINTTSNYNGQSISCAGMTDGSVIAIAVGGTGSLDYRWTNPNHVGASLSGIGEGLYHAFAKDLNGCEGSNSITLIDPQPVLASVTSTSNYNGFGISCFGLKDGSISVKGNGGTGVYSFLWMDNETVSSRSNLNSGSYVVKVSDNNGCSDDIDYELTSPTPVILSVAGQINISCHDGSDGEIKLNATGGVGQYEYSKNNGVAWQSGQVFTALTAANFSFITRDANQCSGTTSTLLTQPSALQISFTDILPAFCANPIGAAKALVTGGVEEYRYEWINASNLFIGSQNILSNVPAGIYTIKVEDAHHCVATNQVPITSTDGAKSTWTETPANCFDSADGSALLKIVSGDGPFKIEWPDGQNQLKGVGLKNGTYFVGITDGHDCRVVEAVTVTSPPPIALIVNNKTSPSCNGSADGEIKLDASGGVGNYSFEWNGRITNVQSDLKAGVYYVKVKDAHNCILDRQVELLQPDVLTIQVSNSRLATCKDGCDGALQVIALGGNGNYQYDWTNGNKADQISNICPGDYSVTVTDLKGCAINKTITLLNTSPPPLDLGGGVTLCVGQTYILDAGTNWKSYSWKGVNGLNSNKQSVLVKDAGEYILEATTKEGCIAKDTFLLETSLDLLKASFLLPHEAEVGDTVVFIDITWPLPETISWNFPPSMRKVYDLDEIVLGQFNKEGVYDISLKAALGECKDYITKSITILKGVETGVPGGRLGYEEYVKNFNMYPNPTEGNFEVGVELIEEAPVTISIWNSSTGIMMKRVSMSGKSQYKAEFDLRPLGFGTYVIRLDHAQGKVYLRFVVH